MIGPLRFVAYAIAAAVLWAVFPGAKRQYQNFVHMTAVSTSLERRLPTNGDEDAINSGAALRDAVRYLKALWQK